MASEAGRFPALLRSTHLIFLGLALCCLSTAVKASPVEMSLTGVNGAQAFGVYVGPYYGTMNGTVDEIYCVDILNHAYIGEYWEANLTPITAGADLSETRFGSLADALKLYQEAAWLTLQYQFQPSSQYGDIQATIWQLLSSSEFTPSSSFWSNEALNNYTSCDYTNFRIVTNLGPVQPSGQVQEFLTQVASPVPEPGTNLLIGFALVSLGCSWKYARR
jgi:hypothetical protein